MIEEHHAERDEDFPASLAARCLRKHDEPLPWLTANGTGLHQFFGRERQALATIMAAAVYPSLYQLPARVWLEELGRDSGHCATLDQVPSNALDRLAEQGFQWLWLMGVWQTGEAGRRISLANHDWRADYRRMLPDFQDEDVVGSPFAIQAHTAHRDFGGDAALARFRERLANRGIKLMLDFVPNHTAIDHAWAASHLEFYIHGSAEDLARQPRDYYRLSSFSNTHLVAHGRDPYFPAWVDTLQLNYRHLGLRRAMQEELLEIAERCDGVRCDMAMLLLPDVMERTWGDKSRPLDGSPPIDAPFWPETIAMVKEQSPEFVFLAEVYWDLEWTLMQQGFDYTYDKRMYDRLRAQDAGAIRGHLWAADDFQRRSVRFLENHDEPRAAAAFPREMHKAAALLTMLVPGVRFFQEGQLEGRQQRWNVHLRRRMDEPVDVGLQNFYARVLELLKKPQLQRGSWRLSDWRPAWSGNSTWERFVVCWWSPPADAPQLPPLLVAVNFGPTQGQCVIPWPGGIGNKLLHLADQMQPIEYQREQADLVRHGLYLDLPAWGYHVLEVRPQI